MVLENNGKGQGEIEEHNNGKIKSPGLHLSTSHRGLLGNENPQNSSQDSVTPLSSRGSFFDLDSPTAKFRLFAEGRDKFSRSMGASSSNRGHGLRDRLSEAFAKKIDWGSLITLSKDWIRNPLNMALFAWIVCVALSGAILFMVMTGMLNHALPKKSQRDTWFEISNQILNALFTLMCLYQHPKRIYHLVLLCRWESKDITKLRKTYCKNGTYKPHEWAHMLVVVLLLNLNCFAQYALCALNLGYRRSDRPAIGVGICITFALGAPAVAGVYSIISPLGRDYDAETDEESQQVPIRSLQKRYSFALRDEGRAAEGRPQWRGGVLDFWDDISLAYLSLFFSFCVFGWNMERLGFGNMFVHIATFILFCMAPFWIFNLAAVNIDNEAVREALGFSGIILCVFGLLYGGFWRIQMRKRFNLPANNFCCHEQAVSDCALWLCCCWCALAQEVRTTNFYDIVEDKFYRKQMDVISPTPISPLGNEVNGEELSSGTITPFDKQRSSSKILQANSPGPSSFAKEYNNNSDLQPRMVAEELPKIGRDEIMTPPSLSSIHRE